MLNVSGSHENFIFNSIIKVIFIRTQLLKCARPSNNFIQYMLYVYELTSKYVIRLDIFEHSSPEIQHVISISLLYITIYV